MDALPGGDEMARPIKEIPVLEGEDARRFEEAIKENENKKIPESDYDRAVRNYKKIKLISRLD